MLVLTRKVDQSIVIDIPPSEEVTQIVVTVLRVQAGVCRIGTKAARNINIRRAEIPLLSPEQIQQQIAKRARS